VRSSLDLRGPDGEVSSQRGLHRSMSAWLIELSGSPWHTRHEDVVTALQRLRSPADVDVLGDVAMTEHGYLAFDEFKGLARKCRWALADIRTAEATQLSRVLLRHPNRQLADDTRRRLIKWDEEIGRKGR